MKTIRNIAASAFILAVAVLSVISILGVWNFFNRDVISKSFETLGLLAVVAIVVMIAGRFIEGRSQTVANVIPDLPSPVFQYVRRTTLGILIIAVSLLALLGILAIWEVIQDKDVLYKSLGSLAILAFGAFIITMTCLERENKLGRGGKHSIGSMVLTLILAYLAFQFLFAFGLRSIFR